MSKTITGTRAADVLKGSQIRDLMYGVGGNDTLYGYDGNDLINGGSGKDRMYGGRGDDVYVVDNSGDKVFEQAGEGTDLVMAAQSFYRLTDNVENLTFATARNHLGYGNDLGNVIVGNKGHDKLFGGEGADTLFGGGNGDFLSGGAGNDKLYGEAGKDNLNGGEGNDLLDGGTGADRMFGGRGDDVYLVDNVKDLAFDLFGGGKDEVRTSVDHTLSANIEMMTIVGVEAVNGTGNSLDNTMSGNDASNVLDGMSGNDTLDGRKGNDVLTGGAGADRFVFSTVPSTAINADIITDFARAEHDKIALSIDIFTDFTDLGRISPDAFLASSSATRAEQDGQYLIYNTTSGALYYDPEGLDGRGAIKIAELGDVVHPVLQWTDFVII